MERKLGEIFTYNGKIYQVVKGFSCKGCAFIKNGCCDLVNEPIVVKSTVYEQLYIVKS